MSFEPAEERRRTKGKRMATYGASAASGYEWYMRMCRTVRSAQRTAEKYGFPTLYHRGARRTPSGGWTISLFEVIE